MISDFLLSNLPLYPLIVYLIYALKEQSTILSEIISAEKKRAEAWKKSSKEWSEELETYRTSVVKAHKEDWQSMRDRYKELELQYRDKTAELEAALLDAKNALTKMSESISGNTELFNIEVEKLRKLADEAAVYSSEANK